MWYSTLTHQPARVRRILALLVELMVGLMGTVNKNWIVGGISRLWQDPAKGVRELYQVAGGFFIQNFLPE